jgi:hypothetical protein
MLSWKSAVKMGPDETFDGRGIINQDAADRLHARAQTTTNRMAASIGQLAIAGVTTVHLGQNVPLGLMSGRARFMHRFSL